MNEFLKDFLKRLKDDGAHRTLVTVGTPQGPEIDFGGRRLLNFCSNDYLGLANDPRVIEAAAEALKRFGAGGASSRQVAANFPIYEELEEALGRFKGAESVLLFNSGYQANVGAISALADPGDAIYCDELAHPSLVDGCVLSRADIVPFRHNDVNDLESRLKQNPPSPGGRRFIVTEAVFNIGGDVVDLPALLSLAARFEATVYLDEAHAIGVFGDGGQGLAKNPPPNLICMATLSKAFGSYGAFVAGTKELKDYLVNRARTFIFTAAPPPASAGASLAALKIIQKEPERRGRLWKNIEYFGEKIFRFENLSTIFTVAVGTEDQARQTWLRLMEDGIYTQEILPPLTRPDHCFLRIALTAAHRPEHLDRLLEELAAKAFRD